MNQPELARPARGHRPRHVAVARAPERLAAARVTVACTPAHPGSAPGLEPIELELSIGPEAALNRTWTCLESFGSNWLEAISSARCSQVVLTARLGSDPSAKHLVLELAELLACGLTDSQPLVRVLFRPTIETPRPSRRHA